MAKWLLVDGFNLVYRCFFAIPVLTRSDGLPTNALHGWVKSLWRLMDQERPSGVCAFFDLGGAQDRLALLPEYKAQREEMPSALVRQLEPVKELTRLMGIATVEQQGVEGDDLLASRAVALARAGDEVLVVSSDKDFAQIVCDRIAMLLPPPSANPKLGWRRLDVAGVREKFGVPPEQIADYLAIVGDTSDNIPGVPGVGPKTASKWLQEYGSLEALLARAGEVKPERFREVLAARADDLRRNRRLTTLNLGLAAAAALPSAEGGAAGSIPADLPALLRWLEQMEMRSALVEARSRYEQPELF
ncbi:MAG: 5'-3' exonuclease [Opitutaceae bacterium]|jgi:DNA polymerase-1|nr:5'-3' exonuclease [Opitutaceae bacterium]